MKSLTTKKALTVVALILVVIIGAGIFWFFSDKPEESDAEKSEVSEFSFKDIGELATEEFYVKIVQTSENSKKILGKDFGITKNYFVYSYDASIKAGIDFAAVNVSIDELTKTIKVKLPDIKIFDVSIDNDSLEIYVEKNNIFNPITLEDMNDSQANLKKSAEEYAIGKGLLEKAENNAKTLITGFIRNSSNLKDYVVIVE